MNSLPCLSLVHQLILMHQPPGIVSKNEEIPSLFIYLFHRWYVLMNPLSMSRTDLFHIWAKEIQVQIECMDFEWHSASKPFRFVHQSCLSISCRYFSLSLFPRKFSVTSLKAQQASLNILLTSGPVNVGISPLSLASKKWKNISAIFWNALPATSWALTNCFTSSRLIWSWEHKSSLWVH